MESFDRGTRMGYTCRNGCALNQAAINQISLYMLFQEGPFDVRVLSINAVEEPVAFPSPPVGFTSDEEVIALLQSTIEKGGSLYDKGYQELCIAMYWSALNSIIAATPVPSSTTNNIVVVPNSLKAVICAGLETLMTETSKQAQAWTLRYIMDTVMDDLNDTTRRYNFNWLPSQQEVSASASSLCLARTSAASGAMVTSLDTIVATPEPTAKPTVKPTTLPTPRPTPRPTPLPTDAPSNIPSGVPSIVPTIKPTTSFPTNAPTTAPKNKLTVKCTDDNSYAFKNKNKNKKYCKRKIKSHKDNTKKRNKLCDTLDPKNNNKPVSKFCPRYCKKKCQGLNKKKQQQKQK